MSANRTTGGAIGREKSGKRRRCTATADGFAGRGKDLLRLRGERVERSFAHCYETGGMRRVHLRGRENILKRLLVHVGAFNLSLAMRKLAGRGHAARAGGRFGSPAGPCRRPWDGLGGPRRLVAGFGRRRPADAIDLGRPRSILPFAIAA
jgi:hypothetical protein